MTASKADEAVFAPASDAAIMLKRKEISSRELTEMLLARIGTVNPALNAAIELRREAALQEVEAADGGERGGPSPAGPTRSRAR